jgi:hypothetical protein
MLCLNTAYKAMGILSLALRPVGIKTHDDWMEQTLVGWGTRQLSINENRLLIGN